MDIVLIPAYEPEEVLVDLTRELAENDFGVLVVDDGSGERFASIFQQITPYGTVIAHNKNRGKGAALKTGMRYVMEHFPECENVITCDADGQHKPEDVKRVSDCLARGNKFVLTMRNRKKDIPLRSKVGNTLSRVVFALLTNRYLSDNQSGLRGFHCSQLPWLVEVEKNNYDYEMNVLYYAAKKNIPIATLDIEALYIDNNSSSHFNPILDTVRIYKSLFYLARGTWVAFALAEITVLVLSLLVGYDRVSMTLPGVGAGTCAALILLNKYVFFRKTECYDYWATLVFTVINYVFYTLMCMLLMYSTKGKMPLWISFNITMIVGLPLRYYLHKGIFMASKRRQQ